jgi:sulfite reductase (ferredoxin)
MEKADPTGRLKPWTNSPEASEKNHVEIIKRDSDHYKTPLDKEMKDLEVISISEDSVVLLKAHGSYQQQNRDLQRSDKQGFKDSFQFMLRLKVPSGKIPPDVYKVIDDLATKYGQGDIRATTRQAFQIHGVRKHNLKTVIAAIANAGSSTLGGCGDINRNIMAPPAPFTNDPAYQYVFDTSNVIAELFRPSSQSFAELWLDGEKTATIEYWKKDLIYGATASGATTPIPGRAQSIEELEKQLEDARHYDNGRGIITGDKEEPLYGRTFLPKKFKIAVTVPGDNSVDIYIQDIGLVVILEADGRTLKGYNVVVGGGMGRTNNKESTFARAADHLGFVAKEDINEVLKGILAAWRDHGNREVRANARLKYLVHTIGIDNFRTLVETYAGKKVQPWAPLPPWKMLDWLGWHEQGDGNLFLGVNVEQGRVKDEGALRLKTALRKVVDQFNVDVRLTPHQNVVFAGVRPADRAAIDALLLEHGVKPIEEIDAFTRKSIACPAFPLCGLAQAEAERRMPDFNQRVAALVARLGLEGESFVQRITGCPNGCARPYMAELAFVGQGPDLYQVWLGGSPNQDGRTGWAWKDKMKQTDLEATLEPVLAYWRDSRAAGEAFGDFTNRVGKDAIDQYVAAHAAVPAA